MNKKSWLIFTAVTIAVLTLLVVTAKNSNPQDIDVSDVNINSIQPASDSNGGIGDHVIGDRNSSVVVIEYADYQCPGCAYFNPVISSVVNDYKAKIAYIYRHFLLSYHTNAKAAATIAEAAGLQGKFWEMHDKLFETQSSWENLGIDSRIDYFTDLAKDLGLDVNKFKGDLSMNSIADKISYDEALAQEAGIQETPSVFINGTKVNSETLGSIDKLKSAIDTELENNR